MRTQYRMKQNVFNRFHILHIRSLSELYIYIMLLHPMQIEETGETVVWTDCLSFDDSQCIQIKKQISIEGRHCGIIFLRGF